MSGDVADEVALQGRGDRVGEFFRSHRPDRVGTGHITHHADPDELGGAQARTLGDVVGAGRLSRGPKMGPIRLS